MKKIFHFSLFFMYMAFFSCLFFVTEVKAEIRTTYYDSGEVENETPYVDGKKHGVEVQYYESGEVFVKAPYVDGKKHGVKVWYRKSGKVEEEMPYVNGKGHGVNVRYYENGEVYSKIPYVDGKKYGVAVWYRADGKVKFKRTYIGDFGSVHDWCVNYDSELTDIYNNHNYDVAKNYVGFFGPDVPEYQSYLTKIYRFMWNEVRPIGDFSDLSDEQRRKYHYAMKATYCSLARACLNFRKRGLTIYKESFCNDFRGKEDSLCITDGWDDM